MGGCTLVGHAQLGYTHRFSSVLPYFQIADDDIMGETSIQLMKVQFYTTQATWSSMSFIIWNIVDAWLGKCYLHPLWQITHLKLKIFDKDLFKNILVSLREHSSLTGGYSHTTFQETRPAQLGYTMRIIRYVTKSS